MRRATNSIIWLAVIAAVCGIFYVNSDPVIEEPVEPTAANEATFRTHVSAPRNARFSHYGDSVPDHGARFSRR